MEFLVTRQSVMKYTKHFILLLLTSAVLTSCFKDQDDTLGLSSQLDIRNFIYRGMNAFYLYKADVPELANDAFTSQGELDDYLDNFADPEDLFYNGLLSNVDRFSFLVDDYIALEETFSGVSKSNGLSLGYVSFPDGSNNVFAYVRYVIPNSPASQTSLQRGDIITTINGIQLTKTIDGQLTSETLSLINLEEYTIGFAEFQGEDIVATDESFTLTKVELTVNPVHLATTLDINNTKIGYLMYTSFTGDFDSQLNAAFGQFAAEGISDLVLDLRYNGGGSVETAIDLSSMITGQFEGQVITTEQWNDEVQAFFEAENPARLTNRFNSVIRTGEAINSLNLNRVYVLTSPRTASASELVINGLNPYIDVVQIGTNTTGKFQASITLYDSENFRRPDANPGHRYAIQPLVLKEVNSAGFTDFVNGLPPDVALAEDYSNLGILGNPNEPLLAAALQDIAGFAPEQPQTSSFNQGDFNEIGDSNMTSPTYERMYLENGDELPQF